MANKRKRSKKQNRAIHAKKRKDFDIWAYQNARQKKYKGYAWEGYTTAERKKRPKKGHLLPEF